MTCQNTQWFKVPPQIRLTNHNYCVNQPLNWQPFVVSFVKWYLHNTLHIKILYILTYFSTNLWNKWMISICDILLARVVCSAFEWKLLLAEMSAIKHLHITCHEFTFPNSNIRAVTIFVLLYKAQKIYLYQWKHKSDGPILLYLCSKSKTKYLGLQMARIAKDCNLKTSCPS